MPTLTRLALGASAVSALTVFGTALPAAAQTPARTAPDAQATTHTAKPTTTRAGADRQVATAPHSGHTRAASTHSKNSGAKNSHTKSASAKSGRATAAPARPAGRSRAVRAQEARNGRRSAVLHALAAQRRAAAQQTAGKATAGKTTAGKPTAGKRSAGTNKTSARRSAATAPRTTATRRVPTHARVTGGRTSDNWSGYTQSARSVGRSIASVSASWQVPRTRQHSRGQSEVASDWIGVGGARSNGATDPTLIQAGTSSMVGRAGVPSTYTWYETLPSAAVETPLTTRSGDRVSVDIGRISTNLWRIRMSNATTGRSWSTAVRYRSSSSAADFVTERPNTAAGSTELPDRTATSFRHAKVNGSRAHFQPSQRVTMTDNGHAVSTPSGPEAQGDGFSVCSYAPACGAGSR